MWMAKWPCICEEEEDLICFYYDFIYFPKQEIVSVEKFRYNLDLKVSKNSEAETILKNINCYFVL